MFLCGAVWCGVVVEVSCCVLLVAGLRVLRFFEFVLCCPLKFFSIFGARARCWQNLEKAKKLNTQTMAPHRTTEQR